MLPIDNFNLATKKKGLGELYQLNATFLSLYKSPGLCCSDTDTRIQQFLKNKDTTW